MRKSALNKLTRCFSKKVELPPLGLFINNEFVKSKSGETF